MYRQVTSCVFLNLVVYYALHTYSQVIDIMARKNNSIHIPLQTGFGFEVTDALGQAPAFLHQKEAVYAALDTIEQAYWVSVDVETTGLTDASMPVALGTQEIKQGASNMVRMRTIQARVPITGRKGPRVNFAFDVDKLSPDLLQAVTTTILSRRLFIAHNAGFDLYWLRLANNRQVMPAMVLDSMLLTRLLKPELVLKRAELISHIKSPTEVASADAVTQAAWKSLISGASGGSLADVVLALFGVVVDKTYQKPNNWSGLLGFEHYDYAIDDVVWADRIVASILGIEEDGDIYQAYMGARARKKTVRMLEPQVPELVLLREHGMPLSKDVGVAYVKQQRQVLAKKVDELITMEPTLEAHRAALSNPDAGLDDALKRTLADAFEARGVSLRRTAATGSAQIGEKDLRACRAVQMDSSRPLFNAWVAVCRAKKSSAMALEIVGFSNRSADGRVRSLLSHGPVTGRLSASEPNCFTGDTEILTQRGWVRFDQLAKGEPVAQYHKGSISFVQPVAYVEREFSGNLVHNKTSAISLLTTEGHRCLLVSKTGAEKVYSANEYPEHHLQLHAASYSGGKGLPLTETELRFIVAVQANGRWTAAGVEFTFNQMHKAARVLNFLGLPVSAVEQYLHNYRVQVNKHHPLVEVARTYLGAENSFGSWILELSRQQLDAFIEELAYGDDLFGQDVESVTYSTTSKVSADWVQAAYSLSGTEAQLTASSPVNQTWRIQSLKNCAMSSTTHREQTLVPYAGKVYCVTVPSSYIVVRHEGLVTVTGNCQQFPRDQVFRAMCMSEPKPDCETTTLEVTDLNKDFVAKVAGHEVTVGQQVPVHSSWLAALFWADKYIPEWPKDDRTALNTHIDSLFSHYVVASDFGALDVRVGAALCVRSQREMLALAKGVAVPGPVQPKQVIVDVVRKVVSALDTKKPSESLEAFVTTYAKQVESLELQLTALKTQLDEGTLPRQKYFQQRSDIKEKLLSVRLGWRLAQCLSLGLARGESDYSALRDAFVADIDIHTFTGMKLVGRDPMKEFEGLSTAERKALEKKLKKELGPRRQQGKIANLSLLYGMADAGFQEAAARGYDEHWTMQEAHDIRALWMNAYPEVELWHLWTECLQAGVVYLPEMGRDKPVRTGWWMAKTLAGRDIVAYGLNAALSYQDQSSGADILGMIMHKLHSEHPNIFKTTINQVHDELVFAWEQQYHEEYLPIVEMIMVNCANELTMPYGVPCAVSPATGVIWIKD